MNNSFFDHLSSFSEAEWLIAIGEMLPSVHAVDRNAVQIWFRFYPLDLKRYLQSTENIDDAKRGFSMQGDFGLADRIDSSHYFLYGHRFWPQVKSAIEKRAESDDPKFEDLNSEIGKIAKTAAEAVKTDVSLTLGIAAAGLMTLVQVGINAFRAAKGETAKPKGIMSKSPSAVLAERAKDDSQGVFGFLKTINKKFSVVYFNERLNGKFDIVSDQEIAGASANDRSRNWKEQDERCWEGPVPVECLSASCGTCWVGILGGQEKLSDVSASERRAMKVFGYNQPETEKPFLRLACQARASGNVTVVIPSWNAIFGKKIRGNVDELELEPATTSAKKLRETIASAAGD